MRSLNNNNPSGRPKGTPAKVTPLDPDDQSALVDAAVEKIMTGKSLDKIARVNVTRPPSQTDLDRLNRVLGISVDEFNRRMSERLAILSNKIANRIEEKIDGDEFKPGELGFIFGVAEDKRRALDSRTQMGSAQVNIQVNNYGDKSREEILRDLQMPALPIVPDAPAELSAPAEINPEDVI